MSGIIGRRAKYSGHKHEINKTGKSISKNFDMGTLNMLCSYVICSNRNIRRGAYMNLRNFIASLDMDVYNNEPEKINRIKYIRRALEARIDKGLTSIDMINNYINGGLLGSELIDKSNLREISNQEIDFVNDMITKSLYYTFIDNEMDTLADLSIKWKAANFNEKVELAVDIEAVISQLYTKFRRSKIESVENLTFCLRPELFEEKLTDIRNRLCDPSSMLCSGMIGVNELLGGGFFAGRFYMLLGITGIGKSLTMLDLSWQMKRYNKNITPKDPTKIPAILYITMENDIYETVERLVTMTSGIDIKDVSIEELIKILRTEGELYVNADSPIDIIIKFIPNRSIDTSYLYNIVEDLEDEGYEVLSVMLDHIKRIRSAENISDTRLELGAVVNECKMFAALKNLSFISDSHLNRDAISIIDKGASGSQADLTKMLGKANVGESLLMLDNSDCVLIINKEYDDNGNPYMVWKRVKMRYKATIRDYICQPYEHDNHIRLQEDVDSGIPVFIESIHKVDMNQNTFTAKPGGDKIVKSNYCNIEYLTEDKTKPNNHIEGVSRYTESTQPKIDINNCKYDDVQFMTSKEMDAYFINISDNVYKHLSKLISG